MSTVLVTKADRARFAAMAKDAGLLHRKFFEVLLDMWTVRIEKELKKKAG